MKNINLKNKILTFLLSLTLLTLTSCESKINSININGKYYGTSAMTFEAIVEKGTITIYNTSFMRKEVYWYGTCHQSDLNEENILMSERLEHESSKNRSFFDMGSMNESKASKREIFFTEDSLTFVYDFSGMAVNQVTLYKEISKKRKNDSSADMVPETETYPYIEPSPTTPPKNDTPKDNDSKNNIEENLDDGAIL